MSKHSPPHLFPEGGHSLPYAPYVAFAHKSSLHLFDPLPSDFHCFLGNTGISLTLSLWKICLSCTAIYRCWQKSKMGIPVV